MTAVSPDRLSPDRLAALEEERDFLLESLADLDAELAAGDIDEADHRALTDDYTARAAEVIRAIDEHRDAIARARPPRSPVRIVLAVAGVALVAVIAGVLVAQSSGRREAGDLATGSVPRTATQEARECIGLTSQQKVDAALSCYQEVLDDAPENPTALTYLAWTLVLASDGLDEPTRTEALSAAQRYLDRAVEADPEFADAYAFRAVLAVRQDRIDVAEAELERLDALDPPAGVEALVSGIREEIARARGTTTTTTG